MNQWHENAAQHLPSQPDVVMHPGVYHLSDIDQHYYQQHQPSMMPQPIAFSSNPLQSTMYQNESFRVDPYAQYNSGPQYYVPHPNVESSTYVPGMPIQSGATVQPEFYQSVPPPTLPFGEHSHFDHDGQGYPRRGRGKNVRGGRDRQGQWGHADNHVERQEFYNAHRGRPQQAYNTRGRGRGRFNAPPSSFSKRDMRFGNGDGRHLNEYNPKKHYNNTRSDTVDSQPQKFDRTGTRNLSQDHKLQARDDKSRPNEIQGHFSSNLDTNDCTYQNGFLNSSSARETGNGGEEASKLSARSRDKKDHVVYKSRKDRKGDDNNSVYSVVQTKLPFKSGRTDMPQGHDTRKGNARGFMRDYGSPSPNADKDESQRGTLTDQLTKNQYECMVCCDIIRVEAAIWSCQNCHHVFHLHCTRKWAKSSYDQDSQTWRCPGCQNVSSQIPNKYRCFCGRLKDPPYIRGEIPHSCGESCKKKRKENCSHPCTLLCHPGPCPPCSSTVNKACDCGRVRKNVRCALAVPFKCDQVCGKKLACEEHTCDEVCHVGICELCTVSKSQDCYCGKNKREVFCGTAEYKRVSFSCEKSCGRLLSCGNHVCEVMCHPGECSLCEREPGVLSKCCCGKVSLKNLESVPARQSCLDPVPTCGQICHKLMNCGPPENHHKCESKCHDGDCGPCDKETLVKCECQAIEKDIACEVAVTFNEEYPFKCQKRCGKKKNCGRHKCSDPCCVKDIHICELVCGRKLTCGLHKCQQLCHRGNCSRCMETSFEELTCYCGGEILEPPVPCGTRVPECRRPCTRTHDCAHPVRHNCHSDDVCPPCAELTEKMCMGGHVLRKNIPCHLADVSCGMPCNKPLPCGNHLCPKACHKPPCMEEGASCSMPCTKPRRACGHMCRTPCHTGECPDTQCKAEITISCPCGSRTAKAACGLGGDQLTELAQFQHLSVQSMAESGFQGVDMAQFSQSKKSNKRLECDVNCAMMERNKRMSLALELKNPDINAKLGHPTFSDYLKDFAKEKKNQSLILNVEKNLSELIQTAKQSSQPNRSHAFPPMNRDQRRFVHELAECYGCETKSYDYEPNKNVVVTAFGEKSWLPNLTLSQFIFGDQLPKAPPPISGLKRQGVNFTTFKKREPVSEAAQPNPPTSSSRAWENVSRTPTAKKAPAVDYFDFSTN